MPQRSATGAKRAASALAVRCFERSLSCRIPHVRPIHPGRRSELSQFRLSTLAHSTMLGVRTPKPGAPRATRLHRAEMRVRRLPRAPCSSIESTGEGIDRWPEHWIQLVAKNREAALKRAREKARLDKREAKRAKKAERQSAETAPAVDERALWEEYARLSEQHESNLISHQQYEADRHRIREALGIESDS